MAVNIGGMRTAYNSGLNTFTEDKLVSKEPFGQFETWFNEACKTSGIIEPNAVCLATANKNGIPSCRMMLMKGYGKDGFVFFTNFNSRKGRELTENPVASLCFYWEPFKRTVRVEGTVEKISEEESEEYFNSRPKPSQIGACISPQSQTIESRNVLTENQKKLEELYKDGDAVIPKPPHWGGFRVVPHRVEFWQGQTSRVHDRIAFRKKSSDEIVDHNLTKEGDDGWLIERLAP